MSLPHHFLSFFDMLTYGEFYSRCPHELKLILKSRKLKANGTAKHIMVVSIWLICLEWWSAVAFVR